MARVTVRTDNRAGIANVYLDGKQVAIMERHPYTGNWLYNASTADRFSPIMRPTGMKSATAAAKRAVKLAGLA